MLDIASLTLSRAAQGVVEGEWTAQDLVNTCLSRITRFDPDLRAYITVFDSISSELDSHILPRVNEQVPAGKWGIGGIPLAVKDLIEMAGAPTTHGSLFFKDYVPKEDATVIRKLKTMGAIILGKLNMHEIALGVTGENPHYGICRNPWNSEYISGGSSSGSAVAVATGMCLGALGSDTGGSIRIPASLCGVVGLKPTYGRVSLKGVLPLSWNLDHVGPLGRCVRDVAILLQAVAGYDAADPASVQQPVDDYLSSLDGGIRGWQILVLDDAYIQEAAAVVLHTLERSASLLQELGAQVSHQPRELLNLRSLAEANGLMVVSDAAAYHSERLQEPGRFGADVLRRLQQGAGTKVSDYVQARRTQIEGRRRLEQLFEDFDLLILPTTPTQARPIGFSDPVGSARSLTRFTAPFNLTGLPALSLPMGLANGLPTAVQLIAAPWAEARLLQAAQALEKAAGQMPMPF
jgi:aspartyl-tRNA(Asn)/glutamyl-tRNA(Gln) amidotransferase subunit A